jgi:hypothetical protein
MRHLQVMVWGLATIALAACEGSLDEAAEAADVAAIAITDPGIEIRAGSNYYYTGRDSDAVLVNCMLDFTLRAGNSVYTIALHGSPSRIQDLPAIGVVGASGAATVVVSSCYGGAAAAGDESIAQYVARTEGLPCESVIGCTGSVWPKCGPNGTTAMPDGSTTPGTPELFCEGTWVNACVPPVAVRPALPGVILTMPTSPQLAAPLPGAATVGCFAGDLPSDIWRRCRGVYNNFVTQAGDVCSDMWSRAANDPRRAECDALVRSCIQATRNACAAMAPPPAGPAAPPPGQLVQGGGSGAGSGSAQM